MPYITETDRKHVDEQVQELSNKLYVAGYKKGMLNYCITKLVLGYLKVYGKSYDTLSDIVGVLEDVKTEFQRRVVNPYEDDKKFSNGDVYDVEIRFTNK